MNVFKWHYIDAFQGEHKEAVSACTEGTMRNISTSHGTETCTALLDDPQYIKALQRRAASNEHLNSWSSLTSAQEGTVLYFKLEQ